jgi:transposase
MAKRRTNITKEQIRQMAREWDTKSLTEFAKEFDVSIQTITRVGKGLHAQSDGQFCKPKKTNLKDTILEALQLLREEEGEEMVQYVI